MLDERAAPSGFVIAPVVGASRSGVWLLLVLLLGFGFAAGLTDDEELPLTGERSSYPGSCTLPARAFGGASGLGPAPALTGAGGDDGGMLDDDGVSDGTTLLVDDSEGSVTTLELLPPEPQFVHGAVVTGDA